VLNKPSVTAAGLLLLVQAFHMAVAAPFSVGPVRLSMSSEAPSTTVEVRSGDFQHSMLLQVTPYRWTQKNGVRVLSEEKDLQVFPAVFKLAPGEIRNVFIRSDKAHDAPRYYRLKIEELQSDTGIDPAARLAFLRAFDIPVFVESENAKPELAAAAFMIGDDTVQIDISNQGQAFFAATNLSLVRRHDTSDVIVELSQLSYVLPGSERSLQIEIDQAISDTEDMVVSVSDINGKIALTIPVQPVE